MENQGENEEKSNKSNEFKTYSVPFDLGDIQDNIIINSLSKSFEKQLIDQAFKFHEEGNISEAIKYYENFINQGFVDSRLFSNYGIILKDVGKLREAEIFTRKSIELNPRYSYAYSNLGTILRDFGKLEEAELSYRKAIEINPNFVEALYNLGSILVDLDKLIEAEIVTRKAIKIDPNLPEAYFNLGIILKDIGKLKEAELATKKAIELYPNFAYAHLNLGIILKDIGKLKEAELATKKAIHLNPDYVNAYCNLAEILIDLSNFREAFESYLKAIDLKPSNTNIYISITRFLRDSDLSVLNKKELKNILILLLDRNDISHKELFNAFNFLYSKIIITNNKSSDTKVSNFELFIKDKLIIKALKKIIFYDQKWEELLILIRRNFINKISQDINNIKEFELEFIIALAEQCFLNEYIYFLNEEEKENINSILNRCKNGQLNEKIISILACYFPLYKLLKIIPSLKSLDSSNKNFNELIKLQIIEPLNEFELSKNIISLGDFSNIISQDVKSQYEQNPYPRWRYGFCKQDKKVSIASSINNEIKPNSISTELGSRQFKVLIAGCGTGQHILNTQIYRNAQVTAIDLSLSSLSYAQRKINELKIVNVNLIQMDILEAHLLEEKFDIIESSGVIHHMEDPIKGLKKLLDILKPNGYLNLGLYSELARQSIIKARSYISRKNIQPNVDGIRDFRRLIFSGVLPETNIITNTPDFYTLSSCRDLCFHSKEHRFTIAQIEETLISNNLNFLGFCLPQSIKSVYATNFPEDKTQTNLKNWALFEEKYSSTFRSMYQFWVSKGIKKLE